ncbi:MAG: phosphotransferase family protein, partial [Myxococcales bacterium]|nr:phosphotransferase family protein [Myxococcales bacterium]
MGSRGIPADAADVRSSIDASTKTRAGEELALEPLRRCLAGAWGEDAVHEIEVEQFPSGHSNLTYLLRVTARDGASRELVLRRPPFGNRVKTAHDMGREHRLLSALHPSFDKAPRPVFFSEDESILGAPFYLMERIPGVILRRKPPAGLTLDEATLATLADRFIDTLVELHELPYEKVGLGDFGKPNGYVERQVSGWTKRYLDAKTDEIPEIERVAEWLAKHKPASSGASLIHNDFKDDNLVLDPADLTRVIGVLDWEMATIGDPMMDLATALAYWIQADDPAPLQTYTFGPTNLPGSPTRREMLAKYAARRPGSVPSDMRFYNAFALFKNAVVAQQIYARWKRGATKDPRFEMMIFAV